MWMMISKTSDFRLVEQTLTLDKSVLPVCICVHVSVHAGVCTCKCVHGHLHRLAIFQLFIYVCMYLYMTYITYIYIYIYINTYLTHTFSYWSRVHWEKVLGIFLHLTSIISRITNMYPSPHVFYICSGFHTQVLCFNGNQFINWVTSLVPNHYFFAPISLALR